LLSSCKDSNTAVIITTHATHLIPQNQSRIIRLNSGVMEES